MNIDNFLTRFDQPRKVGRNWMVKCAAMKRAEKRRLIKYLGNYQAEKLDQEVTREIDGLIDSATAILDDLKREGGEQ